MELTTRLNTIFLMIGPSECGKTTFAKNYLMEALRRNVPEKNYFMNISYLSSDEIRQELLGHDYDKYANVMLMSSEQAFSLLFEKLKLVTSFPLNADFVVIDSTGLSNEFREQVRAIAAENHYRVEVILFNYKNREDYLHTERVNRSFQSILPVYGEKFYRFCGAKIIMQFTA